MGLLTEVITLVVSVLTALGLLAGLSESRRLRHKAAVLKELSAGLPENAPQQSAIGNYYSALTARLIARQLFGTWRFIWPWIPMMGLAYIAYDTSYRAVRYIYKYDGFDYVKFSLEVTGAPEAFVLLPGFVFLIFPKLVHYFVSACMNRAAAAVEFHETGTLRLDPLRLRERQGGDESDSDRPKWYTCEGAKRLPKIAWDALTAWWWFESPVLFFYSLASLIGVTIAIRHINDPVFGVSDSSVARLTLAWIVLLAVTSTSFLYFGIEIKQELGRLSTSVEYEVPTQASPNGTEGQSSSSAFAGSQPTSQYGRSAQTITISAGLVVAAILARGRFRGVARRVQSWL